MEFSPKIYQLVPTGINKSKTTDKQLIPIVTKKYENDFLYEQLQDLVNPQFRSWYCERFFVLGRQKVMTLASQARADGREPRKLFSKLLKESP